MERLFTAPQAARFLNHQGTKTPRYLSPLGVLVPWWLKLFCGCAAMLLLLSASPADAADSYSINAGASQTITEHTVCHVVTNGLSQGLFVPTKTATEWTSFRTNTPPGVTSVVCDTTPNNFDFTPNVTGAALSTVTTAANTITIAGINAATPVSVSGTGAQISINGGAWVTSGSILNGQTLRVRLTSSAAFSTAITATVNVGGVTDTWSVTTRAANNCTVASGATWTVSSSTCTVPTALTISHGSTGTSTDSTAPTTGSKTFSCTDGALATSGTPTCAASGGSCGSYTNGRRITGGTIIQSWSNAQLGCGMGPGNITGCLNICKTKCESVGARYCHVVLRSQFACPQDLGAIGCNAYSSGTISAGSNYCDGSMGGAIDYAASCP